MKIKFYTATITDEQGKVIYYKRFSNKEYFDHYCRVTADVNPIKFDEENVDREFNIALDIRRFFKKLFQRVENVPDNIYVVPLYSQGRAAVVTMANGSVQDIRNLRDFSESEQEFVNKELEQITYGELI